MNSKYVYIGHTDPSQFIAETLQLTEADWNEFDFRQKTFDVHKDTRTIPLIFDQDFRTDSVSKTKWYAAFSECLAPIERKLESAYGPGHIVRALLVKQRAKTAIPEHVDSGASLEICYRVHIALITSPEVVFNVGGQSKHMKPGDMWEINNQMPHSVSNESEIDRVHAIIDYFADFNK